MDYSSAQWSSTIGSLLKKTETNLGRNASQPSFGISKGRFTDNSFVQKSVMDWEGLGGSFDFQQFKNFVMENLKGLSCEMVKLNKKLALKDQLDSEFFEYKEDVALALKSIEKRALGEIRRVESNLVQFVTIEKLKNTEEFLKSYQLEKLSCLDLKVKDLKQNISGFNKSFSHESEENLKSLKKKFITIDDLNRFKENWINEMSGFESSSVSKYQNLETMIYGTEKKNEQRLEEESKRLLTLFDKKTKTLGENFAQFNKKISEISEEYLQKFENLRNLSEENSKSIEKALKDQLKLKTIQNDLNHLKGQLETLPNFEEFSKRTELFELSQSLSERQQNISVFTKQEIKRLSDSKPNLLEYIKRQELEEASANLMKKIEMLKNASAGKAEIEKLKKSFQDLCSKEEMQKLSIKLQESEGSYELFIEKLQILEKRIQSVEDKSLENWRKPEERTISKPPLSEPGSKETESTNLSKRNKKNFELNPNDFVASLVEEFVNCEIDFGVKTLKKPPKNTPPSLKFANFRKTPSESPDDLNNAVIINTDMTNKSESPIDFSKI